MLKTAARLLLFVYPMACLGAESISLRESAETTAERADDPPVFIWRTDESPRLVSEHGGFVSYQVNVGFNGQNIVGDAANEPSITVDGADRRRMAIGWRQFNTVQSNFRQGGWGYTNDGGVTWMFPGVLDGSFRSDPVLMPDASGSFFYLSLVPNFYCDIWRSTTYGQSWNQVAPARGGDKQWFVIDTTTSPGRGFQYQSWSTSGNNYQGRQFTRSTDGGVTWLDPIYIPEGPSWGTLDVDSSGNLYVAGVNLSTGVIWCVRSSDAKNAAVVPTFDQSTAVNLGGSLVVSMPINPVGLTGQVTVAADRSGTATHNNIYVLASVQPPQPGGSTQAGTDVMFAKSTDGGRTFSAPRRINDDPVNPNAWHWFGTMSVAPNGRIDAIWLDTRNSADNIQSQLFYSYSMDGGETWSPNVAASASFDPRLGYPNQPKIGDYITVVSDNGGANVAYCATFNGEQDIYYVRVSPPAETPTPTPTATPTATPTPAPSATPTTTPIPTATPTPSPSVTPTPTATPTPTPTPVASPTPRSAQPLNLSTRVRVETGENVGIGGFIITGNTPKRVLLRAIGPSLRNSGVDQPLSDPVLELYGTGEAALMANDNWREDPAQAAQIEATGIPPGDDLESAVAVTLAPGAYTAVVREKNGTAGIALIEVYDLAQPVAAQLANISTRANTGGGEAVVIGGFILGNGSGNGRVAVRGIGPSLAAAGVRNHLENPLLELRGADGDLIATNDNWQDDPAEAEDIAEANLAPTDALESALIRSLPPGGYTAVLTGANDGGGVGLIEIYDIAR